MKKFLIALLVLFILTGCSSEEYQLHLADGVKDLEESKYSEALRKLELAKDEKDTPEVTDLLTLVNYLIEGEELVASGLIEESISIGDKILKFNSSEVDSAILKVASVRAEEIINKSNEILKQKILLEEELESANLLAQEHEYEEALLVIKNTIANINSENKVIAELLVEADENILTLQHKKALYEDVLKKEKEQLEKEQQEKEQQEKEEEEKREKIAEEQESEVTQKLTVDAAIQKLKNYLNIQSENVIEYDYEGEDEAGNYIIQLYQIVVDTEYGDSHANDVGNYKVNPDSGEIIRNYWIPEDFDITGKWISYSSEAIFEFHEDGYVDISGFPGVGSGFYTVYDEYIRIGIDETDVYVDFNYDFLQDDLTLNEAGTDGELFLYRAQ